MIIPCPMSNFPGLHGYPSHFEVNLKLIPDQITSIIHYMDFMITSIPPDLQTPLLNTMGYLSYMRGFEKEAYQYFRAVQKQDPNNIVTLANLAHISKHSQKEEEDGNGEEYELQIERLLQGEKASQYIASAHVEIAVIYFYAGLTTAAVHHLTAALKLLPSLLSARLYLSLFSYLSTQISLPSASAQQHLTSLRYIHKIRQNFPLVEYLIWVIELKSAFLVRSKTNIIEEKLLNNSMINSHPYLLFLAAKELYEIGSVEKCIYVVGKSLRYFHSAQGFCLLATCQKYLYDKDLENTIDDMDPSSNENDVGTNIQVVVEMQANHIKHDGKVGDSTSTTLVSQAVSRSDMITPVPSPDNKTSMLSPRRYSGTPRSRPPSVRRSSPKEQSEAGLTEIISEVDEELTTDPKLTEIFDNIRMACSLDPFDVDQVLFLTEILISCRKLDLAILYLHEVVTRGSVLSGEQRIESYIRLASCHADLKQAEKSAKYLQLYIHYHGPPTDTYINLAVKLADLFIKMKKPLQAKEWLVIMEKQGHPGCEHFAQRIKRLIAKDKNLLDAFNMDRRDKSRKSNRKKINSNS